MFYPGTTNSLTLISNGELYTNALADYSASSTIAGFSSISTKYIYTKKIGKTVNVNFGFQGTSNSPTITFTLPYETAASTPAIYQTIFTSTNSTSAIGILYSVGSAYSVEVWPTAVQGSWTNGASGFWGQFSYQSV